VQYKGFVDLQVNGYLGIDFSQPGLTLEGVRKVTKTLVQRGTVAYCPTVITSSHETYEQNLPILAKAMTKPDLSPHLLGIHLEGPFISPKDGARGAHSLDHVCIPDSSRLERLLDLSEGQVSILTVAPELIGAEALIRYASDRDIEIFLGHHLADANAIRRACEAGATASTHLGNGIPNQLPRHTNPIWDQLAEIDLNALLITDGHHLPDSFIRVVSRVKAPEKMVVTSDSAPVAGYPPGRYQTLGQDVVLEESGRLWNPVGNHLVGSSANMLECMNYLAGLKIMSEADLCQVGYHNPLALIGKDLDLGQFTELPSLRFTENQFSFR
jgi:N-acetylglucosamine-6-phosphate deacetylase